MASPLSLLAVYAAIWVIITVAWWAFKAERFGLSGLPAYLMYRTTRLNKWIETISGPRPTAWRTIWNVGIVTGIGLMTFAFYFLAKNLTYLFVRPQQAGPVQPIVPLPGLGVSFETFPYLVFALSVVVASHELSHGIASLVDRVPLKSTGVFFAHIVMGGFVEPDEEKLNQARNLTKLRVFAAGSFTNVVLGILCILLLVNFPATTALFYNHGGVSIGSVSDSLPAHSSGLEAGDVLVTINGTKVSSIADLRNYMSSVNPGQEIVVGTQRGNFPIKTAADPSNSSHALIGIGGLTDAYDPKMPFLSPDFPMILFNAGFWLINVLISVAFINMLPMFPFDGDKFLEVILNTLGFKRIKEIRMTANAAAYALLILNVGLSLFRFGFLRY